MSFGILTLRTFKCIAQESLAFPCNVRPVSFLVRTERQSYIILERLNNTPFHRGPERFRGTEIGPEVGSDVKVSLVLCVHQFIHVYPVLRENWSSPGLFHVCSNQVRILTKKK